MICKYLSLKLNTRSLTCDVCKKVNQACHFLKLAIPGLFFIYFCPFKQTLQFAQQLKVKNFHPVSIAGIWTLELLNMSLLP